jgi:multiple sugar transport system permease protein
MRVVRRQRALDACTYLLAAIIVAFCICPIVWLVLTSLKLESDIVTSEGVIYLPSRLTLQHYAEVWSQTDFPTLFRNSLVTALTTIGICVLCGTPAAYALARQTFRGRRTLLLSLLVVRMFPAVMVIVPLFVIMRSLGLLDSNVGLALAYSSFLLPLFIWLVKGFFDALPPDLEDAARIDGCSRLGALVRIALPLARNGILATSVSVAIAAWNEFLFALMLTTSAGSRTWPVGLQLMIGEFQLPWGALAAGGVLSIIPVVLLFALVQRTMVQGLTEGATKG